MAIVRNAVSTALPRSATSQTPAREATSTPRPIQLILIVFHNYLCNVLLRTLLDEVVRYPGGQKLDKPWPAVD